MTTHTPSPQQSAAPQAISDVAVKQTVPSRSPMQPLALSRHLLGDLPAPNKTRHVWRAMAAGLLCSLLLSAYIEIDQVAHASAQLVVLSRTQLIQSPDGGVLTQLHVHEGDSVKAGQLLVTLQKERAQAAVDDSQAKVAALRITVSRLQSEAYGKPLHFAPELEQYREYILNQTELFRKRQAAYKDDINALSGMLLLAQEELNINKKLEAAGDVSRAEILRLERSVADIKAQMSSKRNKYLQDAQAEMTKAQEDLNTQMEQLRDRSQILEHTELTAPVAGIVNNIKVNTVGGVLRAGDTVMELLPTDDRLIAEAKVSTTDISSIEIGQAARIKLDAYDASIYGSMSGKVFYISPDVLTEETRQGTNLYYRVRIRIEGTEFHGAKAQDIKLLPGLTASVDIKARKRTILSYLTKPLTKTMSNSMGER